jgi:OmpA-OmpF porin, OOP family
MKKLICGILCMGMTTAWAQNAEHKWNIGGYAGLHHYNGDLGNGWYDLGQAYYGFAGISVSRYLSRNFDATILGTRGEAGYVKRFAGFVPDDGAPRNFLVRLTTVNAMLRYFPLGRPRIIQPYLVGGLGVMLQRGLNMPYTKPYDFAIPSLGAGLQFPVGGVFAIQLQETFIYSSTDQVDRIDKGINDMYLLHMVGLTINIAKFWKKTVLLGQDDIDGKDVDKCMKMPRELNSKSKAARKESRKARRAKKNQNKS